MFEFITDTRQRTKQELNMITNNTIKLRVYDTLNKQYVIDPSLYVYTISTKEEIIEIRAREPAFIIEHCIGLKDFNGDDIYVNDVLGRVVELSYHENNEKKILSLQDLGVVVKITKRLQDYDDVHILNGIYATPKLYPCHTWLNGESMGYDGDDLQEPENWVKVGTLHDERFQNIDFSDYYYDHDFRRAIEPIARYDLGVY